MHFGKSAILRSSCKSLVDINPGKDIQRDDFHLDLYNAPVVQEAFLNDSLKGKQPAWIYRCKSVPWKM